MAPGKIEPNKWQAIQTVLNRETIVFAALYGSQAVGEATSQSDIDIAIQFTKEADTFTELFRIEEEYSNNNFDDSELDLTILNDSHEKSFVDTIREQAVYLCGDEDKFDNFVS